MSQGLGAAFKCSPGFATPGAVAGGFLKGGMAGIFFTGGSLVGIGGMGGRAWKRPLGLRGRRLRPTMEWDFLIVRRLMNFVIWRWSWSFLIVRWSWSFLIGLWVGLRNGMRAHPVELPHLLEVLQLLLGVPPPKVLELAECFFSVRPMARISFATPSLI